MKKVLFLIHDLGHGGAEKVLVSLVNNMDKTKFDITVMTLFGGGVNEQFLASHIHYRTVFTKSFPGNSHVMKLFTPQMLHKWFIKEEYDIEVAYLEGPTARIVSGCHNANTKCVSWIHCNMQTVEDVALGFRNPEESQDCYNKMDLMVFVSRQVQDAFHKVCPYTGQSVVLYNTNESDKILKLAVEETKLSDESICWCGVGKLADVKGFDRMIRIQKRLIDDGHKVHLYILGEGQQRTELERLVAEYGISQSVTFLGYQTNPYKYVAKCDFFVCASHSEGFSTATTEALIVGTPVCTVDVSGMREMLGENNEYGIVVENNEDTLYLGIKRLIDNPEVLKHYKKMSIQRGKDFNTEETVNAVQNMLLRLMEA